MTRIFEPSDFGIISLISTTVAFFGLIIGLGISAGIFRHYYEIAVDKRPVLLFSGIISQMVIIGSMVVVFSLFSGKISSLIFGTTKFTDIITLALIQIPIVALFEHFMTLLRYQNRPKFFMIISTIQLALNLGFLLLFVVYLRLGIPGIFLGTISAYIIPIFILLLNLKNHYSFKLDYKIIKDCMAFSLPLLPGWIINMYLMQSNRYFLQAYYSPEEVGLYSIGFNIAGITSVLIGIFFLAWDPIAMKLINDKKNHYVYDSIARLFLFGSSIIVLAVTFFAKEILVILTTPNFYPAFAYPGLLAFGTMTFYLNYFLGQGIIISKKTIYQSISRIMGAIVATLFFIKIIPQYGGLGASIGLIAGFCTASIFLFIFSSKLYLIPYKINRIIINYVFTFTVIIFYLYISNDSYNLEFSIIILKLFGLLIVAGLSSFIIFTRSELKGGKEKIMSMFYNLKNIRVS
jgi:O-antigen/teichoic acid export membrane protein